MRYRIAAFLCLVVAVAAPVSAQSTVFVVRHAERADTAAGTSTTDPDLSTAGHARAESLATALKDAGITAIYTTTLKRTRQTAAPLAKALGLTPIALASNDTAGVIERLQKHRGAALVVGHSNTVPEIVKLLGVADPVTVADTEFDRLFVVVRPAAGTSVLVPLRFR